VRGAWCVVRGAWCVVRGAWCVVRGAWCVVRGAWCVVRGAWCVEEYNRFSGHSRFRMAASFFNLTYNSEMLASA
jgi:hypothetical protein